jgi:xanthine dehydrogenase/oxidase
MGQGLHTKVVQLVASTLSIPHECVFVSQSSTDHIPNATSTAGSVSFDLYGSAALSACEQLNDRLAPYLPGDWHEGNIDDSRRDVFTAAVSSAYFDRVDLCAHGFFINHSDYNFAVPSGPERGTPFAYFTTGVACSECEVDLLSGDMRVLRADILMDLGISPNPAIDIGQVEGAYVQGMGYYTLEETVWGSTDEHRWLKPGQCFTRGPGNYKIPAFNDVPVDMRVTLLGEAPNPRAVHSSKAVGEPPLFLGATAALAARNAIRAAVRENGGDEAAVMAHLDTPLSAERLRMLVGDATAEHFTAKVVAAGGSKHPALFC